MREVEHGTDALQDLTSGVGDFEPDGREHLDDVGAVHLIDGLPADQRENVVLHAGNPVAIVLVLPAVLQRLVAFARCGFEAGYHLARLPSLGNRIDPCRSEEHTSELQSLMRISYAVFCLKKKKH